MRGMARSGSGLRVGTRWTRARRRRQWAPTAVAALVVGYWGVGSTAGSGLVAGGLRR